MLFVVVLCGPAAGQELDTIYQAYAAIADGLGHKTVAGLDTAQASCTYLRNALNAGLRAVQHDAPFIVKDEITIIANTFIYTIGDSLVRPPARRPGEPWQPSGYSVVIVSPSGKVITGVPEKPLHEVGVTSGVPFSPLGFAIRGDELILWPATDVNSVVHVYGPGEVTTITGAQKMITHPPETELRWAAVYHAIATIAGERNELQTQAEYAQKYYEITGKMPAAAGVQ